MLELFEYEFFRNALFTGLLASVICGIIGTFVVTKRLVFVTGGLAHAAFGGIGLGYFLGVNPVYIGFLFSAGCSAIVLAISRMSRSNVDSLVGMVWAFGMAVGVLFVSLTPGFVPDLMSFLFGNILIVPPSDLRLMAVFSVVLVGVFSLLYHDIVALALDEEFARLQGRATLAVSGVMWVFIALSVVLMMKVVGIMLVISLVSIPPATAALLTRRFHQTVLVAIALGVLYCTSGILISAWFDLATGAVIILVAVAGYLTVWLGQSLRQRRLLAARPTR